MGRQVGTCLRALPDHVSMRTLAVLAQVGRPNEGHCTEFTGERPDKRIFIQDENIQAQNLDDSLTP